MTDFSDSLCKLKLFGIKEGLECRMSEAASTNLSHQEFLQLLLEDEVLYRENRKFISLKNRAKFKDHVLLESFDTDPKREISKTMIKKMQSLDFLKKCENIIFLGGTGAGKSYLAQAIGHQACLQGYEVFFIPTCRLFDELVAAEKSGTILSYFKKISKVSLLIIDDFGLRNYTHHEATLLYQILEDRHRKASTIVTSQVRPTGWKKLFEDEVISEAIVDRIKSIAHEIFVKGDTYRDHYSPKDKIKLDVKPKQN